VTRVIFSIFLVMHSVVHLIYFGQSAKRFEMQPGLTWPDGSWAFSKLLGESGTRTLASLCCILVAAGFVAGSAGLLLGQPWWRMVVVVSAAVSAGLYILFWNGQLQHLDGQGGVGILIDLAILVAVLVFRWPKVDF
jgi:hypothetical protein